MIERVAYQDTIELIVCLVLGFIFILLVAWITAPPAAPAPPPVILPPPPVITTPTPRQTPEAIPTIKQVPVLPYLPGERWEGQWFKWFRPDISGLQDLDAGIIVYRHAWLDQYSWYNNAMGQYYVQKPNKTMRYFIVWVHQEVFESNESRMSGFYPFYEDAFVLQVKGVDNLTTADTIHNPTCRILEFDNKYDLYNVITAPPFGYYIKKTGWNMETGGYVAQRVGLVQPGPGNAVDGYILYEVPEDTFTEDVILLGNFQRFGNAYWRFDDS